MAQNIFIQREKGLYCVVFPKCGWTLFRSHCLPPKSSFHHVSNNKLLASKIHIDAFFIRHPVDRIISAFKNKYLDEKRGDKETEQWIINHISLPREDGTPNELFDSLIDNLEKLVIRARKDKENYFFRASKTYFDGHFCPLVIQMRDILQKEKLFLDIRKDIDYLNYLGIDSNIVKNSSQHVPFDATPEQKQRLAEIYEEDVILYENYEKNRHNRPPVEEL